MARRDLAVDPIKNRLYWKWSNMIQRCSNPNNPRYPVYGGKGIKVSAKWLKFDNFYEDMSHSFKFGLTLDRIESTKGYSPDNCRWTTQKVQQNNRTNNYIIEYEGIRDTLENWAAYFRINSRTLRTRLSVLKWPIDQALHKEVRYCGRLK